MRYTEIIRLLFEDRSVWVIQNLGPKITAAAEEETRSGIYRGPTDAQTVVGELVKMDPERGKNLVWIARLYANKQFRLEDAERVSNTIAQFLQYRRQLEVKDLNAYPNLDSLYNALEAVKPQQEQPTTGLPAIAAKLSKVPDVDIVVNAPHLLVVTPTTTKASRIAADIDGTPAAWCTKNSNNFEQYSSQGPLYIIFSDVGGRVRKWQFHVESNQYMNARDTQISQADIKALSAVPAYAEFLNMLIKKHYGQYLDADSK